MSDLSPALVMRRLEEIDRDLADRQNALEQAARNYHIAAKEFEHKRVVGFLQATGTVEERKSQAYKQAYEGDYGNSLVQYESEYEALKAAVKVLTTRASIGQSILRAQTQEFKG